MATSKKKTTTKPGLKVRHYHLIPGTARANPDDTLKSHKITWIETPQGLIEEGCERRLHTLFASGTRSPDAFVAELVRLAERAIAISRGAPSIEPKTVSVVISSLDAPKKVIETPKQEVKAAEPAEVEEPKEITLKAINKSIQIPDQWMRIGRYLDSGDITHIVPAGSFQTKEEKKAWDRFVTVDIHDFGPSQIRGKQRLRCIRISNNSGGPLLAHDNVKLAKGYCMVEVDKENIITECIEVPTKEAKFLFGPFNSLFRKKV